MKKSFMGITIFFIALLLVGCSMDLQEKKLQNTISESTLTDREKSLLSATNDIFFVFDYNVDNEYQEVSAWVEKYEFGKKAANPTGKIISKLHGQEAGTILFTANKGTPNNQAVDVIFEISIIHGGSSSKISTLQEQIIENKDEGYASTWSSNLHDNTPIKERMVLANIIYAKGDKGISGLYTMRGRFLSCIM